MLLSFGWNDKQAKKLQQDEHKTDCWYDANVLYVPETDKRWYGNIERQYDEKQK